MASGNGRTPAVTQRADTSQERLDHAPNSKLFGEKVGDKCKEVGDKPHKRKWETNARKCETSQPGTGPQAPSLRDK